MLRHHAPIRHGAHRARAAAIAIVAATAAAAVFPATATAAATGGRPTAITGTTTTKTTTAPSVDTAHATQQLTVNLADDTGPVFHGATGALYGISVNGVPGYDLLAPLHIRAASGGPPNGAQHPTGHADQVAPEFFGVGGQMFLIYMQDYYSAWPYQNVGIPTYLKAVDTIVSDVKANPYGSRMVFVPFNEPDWIWYSLNPSNSDVSSQMAQFEQDWTTVYRRIRADDPGALIAGPNTSYYNPTIMADFLAYAKANNVLPDIITWHEGSPVGYLSDHASMVALEKQDGIGPLPIDVNEYGARNRLSVPGQMVQWLAAFEDTKVYAGFNFWDSAGDYSDTTVRNDEPNGQWWLLYWYGQLTGHTVQVTVPQPGSDGTLKGLAALDTAKRQARILVADPTGSDDSVTITGIDPKVFGHAVHVSVQQDGWTGYDGTAYTPLDVAESNYRVSGGSITVPLGAVDPMSAYQIVVTPVGQAPRSTAVTPDTQTYLAADATVTDAIVNSNLNGYAAAGGKDVENINKPDSSIAFHVTVPHTGRYLLRVYYGNGNATVAQQAMRVDSGAWSFVSYPPTLNGQFWSHQDMYLNLAAGTHTITFATTAPGIGTAHSSVNLDDIQLTYTPGDIPGVTGPATSYPAAYADTTGGGMTFAVDAASDGYYRLSVTGPHKDITATVDGDMFRIDGFGTVAYLHAGIGDVRVTGLGTAGTLHVTPEPRADNADNEDTVTYLASAPQNILSGTAAVQADPYAAGGKYVGWIGDGADNTLTFTGVTAPRSGTYRVMVSYADNDRAGTGNYNTNLIDRGFTVSTSAGTAETVYARNTYSWDQFNTVEVTVKLNAGTNTITFGNPSYYAPNIDKITVAAAVVS